MYDNFDPYRMFRIAKTLPSNSSNEDRYYTKQTMQERIQHEIPYDFSHCIIWDEGPDPETMRFIVRVTYYPPGKAEIEEILMEAHSRHLNHESRKYYPRYPDPFPTMYRYSEMLRKRFEKDFKNSSTIKFRRYGNFEPEKS